MGSRRFIVAYAALVAAVGASYLVWPALAPVAAALVGVGSATAVEAGVRRIRPRHARSWRYLGVAVLFGAAARTVYLSLPGEQGSLKPLAWIIFVLHLAMLAFLVAAFRGLAGSHGRGRVAVIDAAVVLLGAGLLAGTSVALRYAGAPAMDGLTSYVGAGYLLRDVVIIAVLINFVTAVRWNTSVLFVVIGVVGLMGNDALFWADRGNGTLVPTGPWALGWLVFFIGVGAAALTFSMADIRPVDEGRVAPLRVGLLVAGVLAPFTVMVIGAFRRPPTYQPVVATVATVIVVLVLIRVIDVALRLRRQVGGESVVRDASAELASALDVAAVGATLDGAVRRLLPPDEDYRLALAQWNPDPLNHSGSPPETIGGERLTHGVEHPDGSEPTLEIALSRKAHADGQTNLSTVDGYGAPTGEGLDAARPPTLVVQADRAALAALEPRLEVLAMQAGLALERMRLNGEIIRHTNDAYFRSLVQNSADVILIVNDDNQIKYASPSAGSIFGSISLAGRPLPGLIAQPDQSIVEAFLDRARACGRNPPPPNEATESVVQRDWTARHAHGTLADVEVSGQDLRDDPSIGGLVVTLRDVTARRRLERELHYRSSHDALTGLKTRRPFSDRLDEAVADDAEAIEAMAGVLYIDLDDLKHINDRLGHGTGDAILIAVGERLRSFVDSNDGGPLDTAARLGGDEFVVLLSQLGNEAAADEAADRVVAALGEPVEVDGHEVSCRASVGIATTAAGQVTATELMRNADLALYAAKGAGKGQWRHYESWMRNTVMARLELRASLERAIEDDALLLHYQPIVNLEDGRPVGFEALVRWQHPTHGLLSPDQFIDVAEESGLIVPIGEWILATAMRAAQQWSDVTDSEPYVGVNVSVRQFRSAGFTTTVQDLLNETGLAPHRLMLEITESLLLRDDDGVWQDMARLRRLGVQIAIDDFGTGYSSLSYLRHVPLDVVKLDRLFVQTMTDSNQQRELVEGIVRLTDVLGLRVIAEGIETDEEQALAMRVGCAFGQGYAFSEPMPAAEARAWLGVGRP